MAGPEIARMVREFELTAATMSHEGTQRNNHHEDNKCFQSRYIRHVSHMVKSIREDGNPFAEQELQTVNNRKILMTESAEKSVFDAKFKGQQQY